GFVHADPPGVSPGLLHTLPTSSHPPQAPPSSSGCGNSPGAGRCLRGAAELRRPGGENLASALSTTSTQSFPGAGEPGGVNACSPLLSYTPISRALPSRGSNHQARTFDPAMTPILILKC